MRVNGAIARESRASARSAALRAAAFLPLAACTGVLDPKGPVGAAEKLVLLDALGLMLLLIVPVILATLGFAWWYRASNTRAKRRPDFAYSGRLEALVWSVPALMILFLGSLAWVSSHDLDPAAPVGRGQPLEIQVVSLDWKWLFIYPGQGVASVNALIIPVGVPVRFRLTSATVMNSFFVPGLGSQIYTMAGMADTLNLQAARPGRYLGRSTMFSGDGFPDMHFTVDAVPAAAFAAWAAATRAHAATLDDPAYARLAVARSEPRPFLYGAVRPGLFEAIVTQNAPAPTPRPSHQPDAEHPRSVG